MPWSTRPSSSSSSCKKFDVFEFNEEEENVEKVSAKMASKFSNPRKFSAKKKTRSFPLTDSLAHSNSMPWSTRPSSSSSSSSKKFDVFEFNEEEEEEEENLEKLAKKMLDKFLNPRKSLSSSKSKFLQAFERDSKPLSKPAAIVDPINIYDEQEEDQEEEAECLPKKVSEKPLEIDDDDGIDIDNQGKCTIDMLSDDDDCSEISSSSSSAIYPSEV